MVIRTLLNHFPFQPIFKHSILMKRIRKSLGKLSLKMSGPAKFWVKKFEPTMFLLFFLLNWIILSKDKLQPNLLDLPPPTKFCVPSRPNFSLKWTILRKKLFGHLLCNFFDIAQLFVLMDSHSRSDDRIDGFPQ